MSPDLTKEPHTDIVDFWFIETEPKQWFIKSEPFDRLIAERFATTVCQAQKGERDDWAQQPTSCLALILLLDQFTRQIYRDTPQAFASDAKALALSQAADQKGWVQNSQNMNHRRFLLMPMMHSEDLAVQKASLPLFATYTDESTLGFAQRHCDIIEKFGRFPHRNQTLGRQSTTAELAFLQQPGSSF
jgi:uncharacterized protein (DUF924 family)